MTSTAQQICDYATRAQQEAIESQGKVREQIASLKTLGDALLAYRSEFDEDDFHITHAVEYIDKERSYLHKRLHWFQGKIDAFGHVRNL